MTNGDDPAGALPNCGAWAQAAEQSSVHLTHPRTLPGLGQTLAYCS